MVLSDSDPGRVVMEMLLGIRTWHRSSKFTTTPIHAWMRLCLGWFSRF
jgi:hypothetical protein